MDLTNNVYLCPTGEDLDLLMSSVYIVMLYWREEGELERMQYGCVLEWGSWL